MSADGTAVLTAASDPAMPLAARVVVTSVFALVAVAAGATVVLDRRGRLRRTGRLGVRTPGALAGDEAFAAANHTAAPFLAVAAVISALSAVLVATTGLRGVGGVLVVVVCGVVVGGLAVLAAVRGERAAARTAPPAPVPGPSRRR